MLPIFLRLYWVQAGWQYTAIPVNEVHTQGAAVKTVRVRPLKR